MLGFLLECVLLVLEYTCVFVIVIVLYCILVFIIQHVRICVIGLLFLVYIIC
jgi:hypothetical protein